MHRNADRRGPPVAERARVRLVDALELKPADIIAVVGGGGKTTAMFRLAQEIADRGGLAITTTTTRIFGAQVALSPAHVMAADATRERIDAALARHRQVLVVGVTEESTGKAEGVSLELFRQLRDWFPDACLLNEADGSRMRPFKAPAGHEPVIPAETTLVIPLVGADVLGAPLDAEHVHRPELVSALSGAALGAAVTPAVVARVLGHPDGGRKGTPPGARVAAIVNKVDRLPDLAPAREAAALLLADAAVERVLLTAVRAPDPVVEVHRR